MKRVLTSAILTFTLFTQPTFAQFSAGGYANFNSGGGGGFPQGYGYGGAAAYAGSPGYGGGYGNYQGVGYYPAMQSCPYNQGVMPGAASASDDDDSSSKYDEAIDKLQAQIDKLNNGCTDDDDNCHAYAKKYNITAMESELRGFLPSGLFALAITDHMENLADCSCAPGGTSAAPPAPAPSHGPPPGSRPPRASGNGVTSNDQPTENRSVASLEEAADVAPVCMVLEVPNFVASYPAAFESFTSLWFDAPATHTVSPGMSIAKANSLGGDRAPAAATTKKNKQTTAQTPPSTSSGNGPVSQTAPAQVAQQPPPAPAQPPVQAAACTTTGYGGQNSCPGSGYWYPAGVCKDHGALDGRICTNEFIDTMDGLSSNDRRHHTSQEVSDCQRDVTQLYQMIQKRKQLQAAIEKIEQKEFYEDTGIAEDGGKHRKKHSNMEAGSSSGSNSISKWGLLAGLGLTIAGGVGGALLGAHADKEACLTNAKLGVACSGNNYGALVGGISGSRIGIPIMQASIYSAASAGGAAGCGGGQGVPYGYQPQYGNGGIVGQNGAFGYPQGYGPVSQFGQPFGMQNIGAGALMPGVGYNSGQLANPYGSPFGASPFGGIAGANGGIPGIGAFGGAGGSPFGVGSGSLSPFGNTGGYGGGYNPYGVNQANYRLGVENPQGYAATMQQLQIEMAQVNGYGSSPYYGGGSYYGGGAGYGGGYGGYAGYGGGYGGYGGGSGVYQIPQYSVLNSNSFNTLGSASTSVFGTTTGTTTTTNPFGP